MRRTPSRRSGSRAVVLAALVLAGCAARDGAELALLYNQAAQWHGPDRNPVIVIPGILGTRLVDQETGRLAWGAFDGSSADPARPGEARVLALPVADAARLSELRDGVVPDGVLERVRVRLLGIPLELQAYAYILATLGAGGYRDEALGLAGEVDYGPGHFTCFQFAYDWRRDNVESAQQLAAFIAEKRAAVQHEYARRFGIANADVRFDIVAHSMGGLVTRYFLRYGGQDLPADGALPELSWEGARSVERVILVGTPNAGSAEALLELVNGWQVAPLLPFYPAALVGTFPATYQLLPRSRHRAALWDGDPARPVEDLLDPALWERLGWGLASQHADATLAELLPELSDPAERGTRAKALQRRALARARAFAAALDRPARPPDDLELFLVAGDAAPTPKTVAVDPASGGVRVIEKGPGDGTVLRSSALLDERVGEAWQPTLVSPLGFRTVLFLPEDHLGLTSSPVFRDNVLFWLLEAPR